MATIPSLLHGGLHFGSKSKEKSKTGSKNMPNPALLVLLGVAVLAALYLRFGTGTEEEPVPAAAPQPAAQSQSTPAPAESSAPAANGQPATEAPAANNSPPASSATGSPDSLPESVIAELGSGKTVVLLFWTSGNSEDVAVKKSVDSVRSGPLKDAVAVHIEPPERVAEYSLVTKDLLQTPAVVLVNPALQTKTFQGFTDAESLQQAVKDLQRAASENQSEQK